MTALPASGPGHRGHTRPCRLRLDGGGVEVAAGDREAARTTSAPAVDADQARAVGRHAIRVQKRTFGSPVVSAGTPSRNGK